MEFENIYELQRLVGIYADVPVRYENGEEIVERAKTSSAWLTIAANKEYEPLEAMLTVMKLTQPEEEFRIVDHSWRD